MILSVFVYFLMLEIKPTDVYEPLQRNQVAVDEVGHIWVLNTAEGFIEIFDEQGLLVRRFGEMGPGPAEFSAPLSLHEDGNAFYVVDFRKGVLKFNSKGEFLETFVTPWQGILPYKTKGGWVYWRHPHRKAEPSQLMWTNDRFKESRELMSCPNPGQALTMAPKNGVIHAQFHPGQDRPLLAVAPSGRVIYAYLPGAARIICLDAENREILRTLKLPLKPVPFSEDWGQEQADRLASGMNINGNDRTVKVEPHFPNYFPIVTQLTVDVSGGLHVSPGGLGSKMKPLVFSPDGKPNTSPWSLSTAARVFAQTGEYAWVLCFDLDNEAAYLKRTALKDVEALVKGTVNMKPSSGAVPVTTL